MCTASPRGPMDKTQGCGPCNAGSNPTEGTLRQAQCKHMKAKNLIILLIILIVVIVAGAVFLFSNKNFIPIALAPNQSAVINIQDKQINDNTKPFVIKIVYPYIPGVDDFNKKVSDAI